MLHLQARVDLEEEQIATRVRDELARAGADVLHVFDDAERRFVQRAAALLTGGAREEGRGRGRLLDDLLVPALHAALAFAERVRSPVSIAEDLHLDVSRLLHVPFEIDARVRERGLAPVRAALEGPIDPILCESRSACRCPRPRRPP